MHLLLALLLIMPLPAHAANYQQCETSSTCTIGEFLYADDYSALPSQSCTLTVKDPAGTAVLTNQAMTSRADGWYSYDVTTSTTTGLFTATMCCVPTDGTMCIDKSYEVKEPSSGGGTSLTAADVWNYDNRTLTSFGSLVEDIWDHGSRTLTSFGDLVGNIWGHNTRTLTDSSSTTVTSIQTDLDTQRLILEKLVQEPIITIDFTASSNDVTQQLESAQQRLDKLGTTIDSTRSEILLKLSSYDQIPKVERLGLIERWYNQSLNINSESEYFANNYPDSLTEQLQSASQQLLALSRDLKVNFGTSSSSTLLPLVDSLSTISALVTNDPLTPTQTSLTDQFHQYIKRSAELDNALIHLDSTLSSWSTQSTGSQAGLVRELTNSILGLNQYLGAAEMLTNTSPKNTLLSLRAILTMNQKLLLPKGSGSVAGMWLEDGSVIWKASIYNPSKLVSLPANLEFHLPREVKPEHILARDDELTINFDPSTDSLKVSGTYTLAPLATTLVTLQTEDVWKIPTSSINSLKQKLTDNLTALGKSQFYSQALTTKQEVDKLLAQIDTNQDDSLPPTERIRRYRENQLTLISAQEQLSDLDDLVAQVKSTTSLKGWIGGSQLASTWGIIMIIIGGFAFFGYRLMHPTHAPVVTPTTNPRDQVVAVSRDTVSLPTEPLTIPWVPVGAAFGLSLLILGGLYTFNPRLRTTPPAVNQVVTTPTPTPLPSPTPTVSRDTVSLQIIPPDGGSVNVRNGATTNADIVMSIKQPTNVINFGTDGDWTQIGFTANDRIRGYWVKTEFLSH